MNLCTKSPLILRYFLRYKTTSFLKFGIFLKIETMPFQQEKTNMMKVIFFQNAEP